MRYTTLVTSVSIAFVLSASITQSICQTESGADPDPRLSATVSPPKSTPPDRTMMSVTVDSLKTSLESDPDNWHLYATLGTLYAQQEAYKDAAISLEKASSLRPSDARLLLNLSIVYDHLGRMEDAIKTVKRSISVDGSNKLAHRQLCELTLITNRFDESAKCYQKLVKLDPGDALTLARYSYALTGSGNVALARKIISDSVEQHPDKAELQNALGVLAFHDRNFKGAVECFRKASELEPSFLPARFNLALAELQKNNRTSAIEQYSFIKKSNSALADELYQVLYGDLVVYVGKGGELKH